MKDYIGKIIKITCKDLYDNDITKVGIVYKQGKGFKEGTIIYSLITLNGSFENALFEQGSKITYTKIDPELRASLVEAYRTKMRLNAFEEKYEKELKHHKEQLNNALESVKEKSGELTSREFANEMDKLFEEKFPSSGGYYAQYFQISSYSPKEVTMSQIRDVEKWASPSNYSFLYEEYDNTMHIDHRSESYKNFCKQKAPAIIPKLQKHCKVDVSADIGDKNWLTVSRDYTFPIKYGYSKKSIEEIRERLFDEPMKHPSIIELMKNANKETKSSGKGKKKNELEK